MSENKDSNAFWDWSTRVYADRRVKDACLKLQDGYNLDVNMLLFCVWTAWVGYGRLDNDVLAHAVDLSDNWTKRVTKNLRAARRALKNAPMAALAGDVESLRANILEIEIDSEQVHQDMLEDLTELMERGTRPESPVAARQLAMANVNAYLRAAGVDRLDGASRAPLNTLLEVAFAA
jgi:uncharacterized protein (TIGR02444 family)